MDSTLCKTCLKPKAQHTCSICKEATCKSCAHHTSADNFSLLEDVPSAIANGWSCASCFDEKVAPEIEEYNLNVRRAKQISFFYKKQSKESRLFRRTAAPIHVKGCTDREEALLRLAFMAVKLNYNMIVDVDLTSEKVRNEGYQTSRWSARGIPVNSTIG